MERESQNMSILQKKKHLERKKKLHCNLNF